MHLLVAATVVSTLAALFLLYQFLRYRHWWLRDTRRLDPRPPIPRVALEGFVPRLVRGEFGPTLASEVCLVGAGDGAPGGTSDTEAIILAVLARDARCMFEFGTATGRTTYLWARNSAPDARVATLTLAPNQVSAYAAAPGDTEHAARHAIDESAFTRFLYSGTDAEAKVTQLYGDSKTFDEGSYVGRCDLIFVDGSHARSYVESDTAKALRMLRPGGVLLWHDYRDPVVQPVTIGVYEYLNELRASLPIVRLGSTSLVGYRAPDARRGMTGGAATP